MNLTLTITWLQYFRKPKDLDLRHQTPSPCVSWHSSPYWKLSLEVFGDGLRTRLGELINPPLTRDSQTFFSSSMYVCSVYTEPTLVVRWTGCHGNGYIPIQQTSDLSSILFLEIHLWWNGNASPKLNMTPNLIRITLRYLIISWKKSLSCWPVSYDNQETTSPHDFLYCSSLDFGLYELKIGL